MDLKQVGVGLVSRYPDKTYGDTGKNGVRTQTFKGSAGPDYDALTVCDPSL